LIPKSVQYDSELSYYQISPEYIEQTPVTEGLEDGFRVKESPDKVKHQKHTLQWFREHPLLELSKLKCIHDK